MNEIINLRLARKKKRRDEADKTAAANRVKHGQSKAFKEQQKREQALKSRALDGHLLQDDQDSS